MDKKIPKKEKTPGLKVKSGIKAGQSSGNAAEGEMAAESIREQYMDAIKSMLMD